MKLNKDHASLFWNMVEKSEIIVFFKTILVSEGADNDSKKKWPRVAEILNELSDQLLLLTDNPIPVDLETVCEIAKTAGTVQLIIHQEKGIEVLFYLHGGDPDSHAIHIAATAKAAAAKIAYAVWQLAPESPAAVTLRERYPAEVARFAKWSIGQETEK